MRRTLLIFVDGLGIGTRGQHNPLDRLGDAASPLAVFADEEPQLPHRGLLARTDACLGVEGRPQSASGQTTILTGLNAPALLGYHKQGFPNEAMREIIREHSIFLQLKRAGIAPNTFANAYTPRFFETRPRWVSATTVAVEAAGMPFRRLEDLQRGAAVYQDFTNELVIEAGFDVQPRTPDEAAEVLAVLVAAHRFTLYEYFITDRVGHAQDMDAALRVISNLAAFVRAVVARVDLNETTVVLTSDHGNVEDLSIRNHTRNLVPTLVWGACRREVQRRVRTLADITPAIIETLTAKEATHA
ncbi:MAG: 2,3-bisphosphoglycerate-independent phosphoglycerate mutase [Pyrinomonadaceae bacterium]|nr:2,3-bisphosphoglycerate-independent phosphoglycerate mutase [Pyrinomonadaceae bacterium]